MTLNEYSSSVTHYLLRQDQIDFYKGDTVGVDYHVLYPKAAARSVKVKSFSRHWQGLAIAIGSLNDSASFSLREAILNRVQF